MLSRKAFNKLSNSLKWGFFSDEVVIIFSKFKKTKALSKEEKNILTKTKHFLKDAINGHNWIEKNTYDRSKSAYAFSQAVRVLAHLETSEQFIKYMEQLIKTTEDIYKLKPIEVNEIDKLIEFFTDYGKNQLEVTEDIINRGGRIY